MITKTKTGSFKYKKGKDVLSSRGLYEKIIFGIVFVLFAVYALSLILPIVYIFINSFQTSNGYLTNIGVKGNAFALPKQWHIENYLTAITGMSIQDNMGQSIHLYEMFFNSLWYVVITSFGGALISAFSAYVLAKYTFVGHDTVYAVAIFTMTVPIVGSTGAAFKLMSDINIYNSPLFMITALSGFGFNFLVLYGFFKNLSWSYAEAVFIDGGGHFTAFFRVMLPQASSSIFTLLLMAAISAWNDYTTPLLYMPDFPTVASGLYRIQKHYGTTGDTPAFFAGLFLSIIPVITLFSCFSGTIMKNFTMGGLKG